MTYLPMQNWLNTLSKTSSVTSSPLISPSAATADLKSIVQKSIGRPSLMLSVTASKASCARIKASACLLLTAQLTPPAHTQQQSICQMNHTAAACRTKRTVHLSMRDPPRAMLDLCAHIAHHFSQQAMTYAAQATCSQAGGI